MLYQQVVDDLAKQLECDEERRRIRRHSTRGIVLATMMRLKRVCNHPSQYLAQPAFASDDSGKFVRWLRFANRSPSGRKDAGLHAVSIDLSHWRNTSVSFCNRVWSFTAAFPLQNERNWFDGFGGGHRSLFRDFGQRQEARAELTAASHVVHFDRCGIRGRESKPTVPSASARKRNVLVHKFVCRGTLEERIDQMIRDKQMPR